MARNIDEAHSDIKVMNASDNNKEDETDFPDVMPLLPLRDVVLFPYMVVPILVVRDASVAALQAALVQDRFIFLVLQKNPDEDNPGENDIYKIGMIGRALQVLKLPNGTAKVLVEGLERAKFLSMEKYEEYFRVNVQIETRTFDKSNRFQALMRTVSSSFSTYVKLSKTIPDEVLMNIPSIEDPIRLADTISAHLLVKQKTKQQLLEVGSVEEQLTMIAGILSEEIEIMELEKSIDKEVKERLHKSQKDYYLHEQMRVIKEELGEDEDDSEIRQLEVKIKKSGMPSRL